MSELVKDAVSGESEYEVKFEEGKLKIIAGYDGKGAGAKILLTIEGGYFLDKLAEAIPGEIDDMVIAAIKGAMK